MDLFISIIEAQYVIFFLVGFAMFAGGIAIIMYEVKLKNRATKISGHISGVAKKNGSYYSLFTFTTPQGEQKEFTSRVGSGAMPRQEKIGNPVTILYVEGETPKINGKVMYIVGTILTIMGIIFAGIYIVNFEFNWMAVLFSFGIVIFVGIKILKTFSKIQSIKNADTFSGAISNVIHESKKSIREKEHGKADNYEKLDIAKIKQEKKKQEIPSWVNSVVFIISISLLIGAYYTYTNQKEFLATATYAEGTVIDFRESESTSDGHTSYTYAPIIKFNVNNTPITFIDSMGSSDPSEQVGDKVDVLYNPNDYDDAQMDKGWLNWILPLILFGFGILTLYSFVYSSIKKAKSKTKNN
jgi:uncharacterized membrane protein YgdD (TMEM256/DUF423 family)